MVVGIGGFRDIGDPNDPRRRMGQRLNSATFQGHQVIVRLRELLATSSSTTASQEGLSIEGCRRNWRKT